MVACVLIHTFRACFHQRHCNLAMSSSVLSLSFFKHAFVNGADEHPLYDVLQLSLTKEVFQEVKLTHVILQVPLVQKVRKVTEEREVQRGTWALQGQRESQALALALALVSSLREKDRR